MNNEEISLNRIENKFQKRAGKEAVAGRAARMKRLSLGGRKTCIGVSVFSILLIWMFMITPLIVETVQISMANQTFFTNIDNTLSSRLPPINTTGNYSNFTIRSVECVDDFIYVPGEELCYPGCEWNPTGDGSVRIVRLVLNIIGVISVLVSITTLVVWVLISCVDWKRFRLHYDFQLARTSLFMVLLCSLILILLNAGIDLTNRDFFFCQSTEDGRSYQLAHMLYSVSNVHYVRILTFVLGALTHYMFLVTVSWVIFALININVVVFFPHFRECFWRRVFCFSIECLICFGSNLLFVGLAIALNSGSPYVVINMLEYIAIFSPWAYVLLEDAPLFITAGVLITLTILIVAKVRLTSLRSRELTGHTIKLTNLEKRLIVYGIVFTFLMLFRGVISISLSFTFSELFEFIANSILCKTVNSPILTLPSNLTGSLNDTVTLYRDNPFGDMDACRVFELEASRLYRQFSFMFFIILSRLIWLPIFFVLIPHITPGMFRRWLKRKTSSS